MDLQSIFFQRQQATMWGPSLDQVCSLGKKRDLTIHNLHSFSKQIPPFPRLLFALEVGEYMDGGYFIMDEGR